MTKEVTCVNRCMLVVGTFLGHVTRGLLKLPVAVIRTGFANNLYRAFVMLLPLHLCLSAWLPACMFLCFLVYLSVCLLPLILCLLSILLFSAKTPSN